MGNANEDLKKLLTEVTADDVQPVDSALQARVRETLAESQYYLAWLMRLEGVAREEWLPELESARQNYRLLAEQLHAECGLSPDDLIVSLVENTDADWSFGRGRAQFLTAEL